MSPVNPGKQRQRKDAPPPREKHWPPLPQGLEAHGSAARGNPLTREPGVDKGTRQDTRTIVIPLALDCSPCRDILSKFESPAVQSSPSRAEESPKSSGCCTQNCARQEVVNTNEESKARALVAQCIHCLSSLRDGTGCTSSTCAQPQLEHAGTQVLTKRCSPKTFDPSATNQHARHLTFASTNTGLESDVHKSSATE